MATKHGKHETKGLAMPHAKRLFRIFFTAKTASGSAGNPLIRMARITTPYYRTQDQEIRVARESSGTGLCTLESYLVASLVW